MANHQNKFNCFIIGEGTLPIQCAEILINQGHVIYGIISADASIINWAEGKNIPYIKPTDHLGEFLSQQPFDYLFSIVNRYVLPQEILQKLNLLPVHELNSQNLSLLEAACQLR